MGFAKLCGPAKRNIMTFWEKKRANLDPLSTAQARVVEIMKSLNISRLQLSSLNADRIIKHISNLGSFA